MHLFVVSFVPLMLAHLLGDFLFQSGRMVTGKQQLRLRYHLLHVLIHASLGYALLGIWGLWKVPLALAVTHFLIDISKETLSRWFVRTPDGQPPRLVAKLILFGADQGLHVCVLAMISQFLVEPQHLHFWYALAGNFWLSCCLYAAGMVAAIWMGGIVISLLAEPLLWQINQMPGAANLEGFPRSGQIIGWLERFLIFVFVLQQQYIAVGFLVTAKSILRFGEIKDSQTRMETEYIIIGTMLSFAWGIGVALFTGEVAKLIFN